MEKCLHCGAEVEFEIDDTDELCPECGWSKNASLLGPKKPEKRDQRNIYEKYPLFIPGLIGTIMLIIAVLPIEVYAYYRILRWIISGIAILLAYRSYESKKHFWIFLSIAMAILFNPIIPFYLDKETWVVIDLMAAVFIFISIWVLKSKAPKATGV